MDPTPFLPFAQTLFDAVLHGQCWAAVAAVFGAGVLAVRLFGAGRLSVPIAIVVTFVLAFGGGLANVLAAGATFGWEVVHTALSIGVAAVGGWGAVELLLRRFFPKLFPEKKPEATA